MKKVILISGSSSGLGKFLAEKFAFQDYIVYAGVRKKEDKEKLEKEFLELKTLHIVELDVTKSLGCKKAIEAIIKNEGRIDVIINNAGLTVNGSVTDFTDEEFLNLLNTNTVGAFRLITSAIPEMKKNGGGKIISITSLNGLLALPGFSIYSASKFALEAFDDSLYYELAKDNIGITSLAPGAIQHPDNVEKKMAHKPAREKFTILKLLMPMVTYERIGEKILSIIESDRSPRVVTIGNDAKITLFLQRFLPNFLWEKLMMYVWNR